MKNTQHEPCYALPGGGTGQSPAARARFIDALYRDHRAELCVFLQKICAPGQLEPEDLVQAVFVRIAKFERIDSIQNPRAYLFKIAMNLAMTSLKSRTRRIRFLAKLENDAEMAMAETNSHSINETRDRFERLEHGISLLSQKQRELIIRSRIRGETYSEISDDTGWSAADISRTLNNALTILDGAVSEP